MQHDIYNTARYPHHVCRNGAWDIYADAKGDCAAIPADPTSGHKPCYFGDRDYVRKTLGVIVPIL